MLTKLLHCTSIVSALVFVLVLKLHVATFSHEDLLQADIRYQKLKAADLGLSLSDGNVHGMGSMPWQSGPLSNQLMTIGWNAEILLVSAVSLALGRFPCRIYCPWPPETIPNTQCMLFFCC